jgi:hypothetical protein
MPDSCDERCVWWNGPGGSGRLVSASGTGDCGGSAGGRWERTASLYRPGLVRHPQSARLARTRAQRWGLWIVLALLVLVSVTDRHAASSPALVDSSLAVTASCGGDLGHDVMCARGLAAAAMPGTRGGREDGLRDGIGVLVASVLLGAMAFAAGTATPARYRTAAGPPAWAPQRLVPARHQLVAIGITRI